MLKNLYRELAMYKTHAAYWWYCTEIESDGIQAEINRQDHLKSQSDARKVEKDIGDTIATFLGLVVKFENLLGRKIDVTLQLDIIGNIKTRPAKEYAPDQSYSLVRNTLVLEDEEDLKKEYFLNLAAFDKIIEILKFKK